MVLDSFYIAISSISTLYFFVPPARTTYLKLEKGNKQSVLNYNSNYLAPNKDSKHPSNTPLLLSVENFSWPEAPGVHRQVPHPAVELSG